MRLAVRIFGNLCGLALFVVMILGCLWLCDEFGWPIGVASGLSFAALMYCAVRQVSAAGTTSRKSRAALKATGGGKK